MKNYVVIKIGQVWRGESHNGKFIIVDTPQCNVARSIWIGDDGDILSKNILFGSIIKVVDKYCDAKGHVSYLDSITHTPSIPIVDDSALLTWSLVDTLSEKSIKMYLLML